MRAKCRFDFIHISVLVKSIFSSMYFCCCCIFKKFIVMCYVSCHLVNIQAPYVCVDLYSVKSLSILKSLRVGGFSKFVLNVFDSTDMKVYS